MTRGKAYIEAGRERIRDNDNYDMTMGDIMTLNNIANEEDLLTALSSAYYMGVEAGARLTEKNIATA